MPGTHSALNRWPLSTAILRCPTMVLPALMMRSSGSLLRRSNGCNTLTTRQEN